MELGVSPLVSTSMVLEFLSSINFIEVDSNIKEDRMLFTATQKICGLAFTAFQAASFVSAGMYGSPKDLGMYSPLIVIQLTLAGLLIILLDEMLQVGYGVGGGISLFITSNVCETIAWKALSPASIPTANGMMYEGAITSFIHQLFFSNNRLSAISEAFYRPYGANLSNLLCTLMVFCIIVALHGVRYEIMVKHNKMRQNAVAYPIKLFYTSNMPIILYSACISNVYFFSQLIYKRFKGSLLVALIGQWQEIEYTGESYPVGGLAYYLSPPTSILNFFLDPFRSIVYTIIMVSSCAYIARYWIEISGEAPKDIAKRMKDKQFSIAGSRDDAMVSILNRYIPQMASMGGAAIGLITIGADLLGCIGSGTGILLAVSVTHGYFEVMAKEMQQGKGAVTL